MRTHRIRKEAMTRPFHLMLALICASSLAFGVAACGSDSTTTTTVEEQQQNQNDQNQNQNQNQDQNNNNQNNNNQNNNHQNNNESAAKRKEECLANAPDPRDCEYIP